jgi:hypothetical protein
MVQQSRNPDLTARDNSLKGILKEKSSHLRPTNIQDQKTSTWLLYDIQTSRWMKTNKITWKQVEKCSDNWWKRTAVL